MAEMVKAKLNGQFDIILPKHRADRPHWYTEEGWEKKRLATLHDEIKSNKNSVIYYVGAEEGEMPALCQIWGAKVVMFEPNEKVWPNVKAIWDANKLDFPAIVFNGFASSKTTENAAGAWDLNTWPQAAYGEVISDHGFKELSFPMEIPQIKIDDLVEQSGVIPTILTMDVEGSEWEVLRGAEQTILKHKPKIWLSLHPEFLFKYFNEYSGDLRNWLKDRGYKEELLDYTHEVHLIYS